MDNNELFSDIEKYSQSIGSESVPAALQRLHNAAEGLGRTDICLKLETLESRYFYMLRLLLDNPVDFDTNIADIKTEVTHAAAEVLMAGREQANETLAAIHRFQDMRPDETLSTLVSDYVAEATRLSADMAALTDARARTLLDRLATDIFNHIWARRDFDEANTALIENIIFDSDILLSHRTMWTHALGLAVSEVFRMDYVDLLRKAAEKGPLRITAFTWLVILMANYEDWTKHAITKQLKELGTEDSSRLHSVIKAILFTKTSSTNIASMLGDIGSRAAAAMNSGTELSPEELMKDANLDKLSEIREQQTGGTDLYFDVFGRMRHFPFFSSVANWFIPFDASHSALWEVTDGEGAAVADTIQRTPYLSDGDKYALLLSMAAMPAAYRSTYISNIVDTQMKMMQSTEFEEAMDAASKDLHTPADVIHMIRRFAEVYPNAASFRLSEFWKGLHLPTVETLAVLNDIIERMPENEVMLSLRARLYYESADYDASLCDYLHLDFIAPDNIEYILGIMRAAIFAGDYEQVKSSANGLSVETLGTEGVAILASAYWLTGERRKAFDVMNKAAKVFKVDKLTQDFDLIRNSLPSDVNKPEHGAPMQILLQILTCMTTNPRVSNIFN
ncbi:MAG: hypothetical protein K2M55_02095 [Muribaculaceae bacterium]|nr:hypothetical protein [Muribaculaceae bacterium]